MAKPNSSKRASASRAGGSARPDSRFGNSARGNGCNAKSSTGRSDRNERSGRRTKYSNGVRRSAGHPQRSARGSVRDTSQLYDLIEGRRACTEALDTGVPIAKALVLSGATSAHSAADASLKELVDRLNTAGISVEEVPRAILDSMSSHGAHQGIMLRTRPFQYAELNTIIQRATSKNELVIVLDHVTDEGNFGAIVRSAEVVGAAGVVIAKARAARVGTAAYKTSAGAVLHLPIAQVSNLASALDELKKAGFWVVGSTEHATQNVWESPMNGRLALVMGSEGNGISQLVLKKCDFSCKLPQRGSVESLNVAQAATVMCYEWMRQVTCKQAALGEAHE
ncbi:23S rRNA (guanosine(2251)-2'-O)-methyltransferase RlmB [Atopobium fossor]|uniref:23S rRNA (guanosine(2251)-2'-O)-methyltransferase RlmB n=1 Tax=Atopobium fossor TaxID=39487 RepID=UPI00040E03B8|nr:23S rRNA (guanosine(2251)-2'-O)-methyltransferase RlmB [Atopobium fossor]